MFWILVRDRVRDKVQDFPKSTRAWAPYFRPRAPGSEDFCCKNVGEPRQKFQYCRFAVFLRFSTCDLLTVYHIVHWFSVELFSHYGL
jgi:hypothetical protein